MKLQRTIALLALLCCAGWLYALPPTPPTSLTGSSLRNWLKTNWYNPYHNQLGYNTARRRMYNYIDNQNNKIECVYSGYLKSWNYGGTGTNPSPINCEHTVPQSWFGSAEPMRSDIHHLFPAHSSPNNSRASWPFAEIPDNQTTKWWLNGSYQTNIPGSSSIANYSEYAASQFEPRESHKGDCARAIFYFYTMYPSQAGSISQIGDLNTLYQWHLQDPVDSKELSRNAKIETYQGNRNPYVDLPDLVGRAWGFSSGGGGGSGGVLISEYVEGSSNNKAIEIANLTGSSISLSGYSLRKQVNGAGSWDAGISLSGSLGSGSVYVVAYSSASSSILSRADLSTSSSTLAFNGNDPIGLFYNGNLVDIVGNFNGGSSNFAVNVTLRRKTSISNPNTSYSSGEWNSYGSDNIDNLGQYSSSKRAPDEALAKPDISIYPNPFQDEIHVRNQSGDARLELLDLRGRVLHSEHLAEGHELTVHTQALPAGIYFLRQTTEDQVLCHRILKR